MKTTRYALPLFVLMLAAAGIEAQVTFTDTNHTIDVRQQGQIKTVGIVRNLSIVDGRLFFHNADVLFSAPLQEGGLGRATADEQMLQVDDKMEYVVKHPQTGDYFFTKTSNKGVSQLFRLHYDETRNGKPVVSKVKLGKFSSSIEHPVFSATGDLMVFSSDDFYGFGGYDLWYSRMVDGEWQEPRNMGRRINTTGNETAPFIDNDFLYYATNSDFSSTGHDFFCTRLIATSNQSGDTVFTFPIGRSEVQRIPYPLSSLSGDYEMVTVSATQTAVFVSDRNATDQLFVSQGRMDSYLLEGDVENITTGNRLSHVRIDISLASSRNTVLFSQYNGNQGHYRLYLQPEEDYLVTFSTDNYLSNTIEVNTHRTETENLLQSVNYPILLLTFDTLRPYVYQCIHLFGSEVGTDLVNEGQQTLESVARFLQQNPQRSVEITAVYSERSNTNYNRLICTSRLEAIRNFLVKQQAPSENIELATPQTHQVLVNETEVATNAILLQFK